MKNCPPTADPLSNTASNTNRLWLQQKANAGVSVPELISVTSETQHDNPLTYNIWLYFEVLCSLNSFSCIVDVSPSNAKNARSHSSPRTLLPLSFGEAVGPVIRNSVTPKVTAAATSQSWMLYCFPDIAMPHNITGIILKLFPSICTANETYFRDSYWHVLAKTLENEMMRYFHTGALFTNDSPFANAITIANTTAATRLQNTKNTEKENSSAPYGIVMMRSCRSPYRTSMPMMPAA
mmetsp:Transcript_48689/g.155596  ORF Transcript_48689/g.155596 Transcript_48689/m.155596 type:complete len:237 (-) Transcript_48689:180-890(-)